MAKDTLEQVPRRPTSFQNSEWLLQRVGWAVLALIIIAALLGVFSDGPLSRGVLENDAARLEYQRFIRSNAETRWKFTLKGASEGGRAELAMDAAFGSKFRILSIQPEPSFTTLREGSWIYGFDTRGGGEMPLEFVVEAKEMGSHAGTIQVNGVATFALSQFAYP